MPAPIYPTVRSFHARHGRIGPTLRAALQEVVPALDVASWPAPVDLAAVLPGSPVVVDFGSGMGHHALDLASQGAGVLAVDVHAPGIARLALAGHPNIAVHLGDGVPLLRHHLAPASIDEVLTDDDDYAEQITAVITDSRRWHLTDEPLTWQPTRYHERALRLGHTVHQFTVR